MLTTPARRRLEAVTGRPGEERTEGARHGLASMDLDSAIDEALAIEPPASTVPT
jgi:hypothetical protein